MSLIGNIKTLFEDKEKTSPVFPITKVKAISDDNGVGLNVLLDAKVDKTELDSKADKTELDNKQEKHKPLSISLLALNWSDMMQTVSVDGVTEDNSIIPVPAPENYTAYCEAGIYCSAQANRTLTFICSEVPAADLIVNVLIFD